MYFQQSPDSGSGHPKFTAVRFAVPPGYSTIRLGTSKLWGRLRARFGGRALPTAETPLPYSAMDLLYADITDSISKIHKVNFGAFGFLGVADWGVLAVFPT